jgi:hypothetical protein
MIIMMFARKWVSQPICYPVRDTRTHVIRGRCGCSTMPGFSQSRGKVAIFSCFARRSRISKNAQNALFFPFLKRDDNWLSSTTYWQRSVAVREGKWPCGQLRTWFARIKVCLGVKTIRNQGCNNGLAHLPQRHGLSTWWLTKPVSKFLIRKMCGSRNPSDDLVGSCWVCSWAWREINVSMVTRSLQNIFRT